MRVLPRFIPSILLLAVMAAALAAACGGGGADPTPDSGRRSPSPPPAAPQATPTPTAAASETDTGGGTQITVINEDVGGSGAYAFNPAEMSFAVGEQVTFTLTAETEFHTFTVEDLDIDESLEAGETRRFTFTFDEAGSFELICLAHPDMTGTITVR